MKNLSILVFQEDSNPTTDYYILPFLDFTDLSCEVKICSEPPEKIEDNTIIIFVRYLFSKWIEFVEKNRKKIIRIIYFMDDDLFDLKSFWGLPLSYIYKIYSLAYRRKKWLISNVNSFSVSNNYLKNKYLSFNPIIIDPYPIFNLDSQKNENQTVIFYHATSSHRQEIKWLYDIVKEVLNVCNNVIFEFIGDNKIKNLFKQLEQVSVIQPMKWHVYRNFLLSRRRQIGIVPVLPKSFNKGRNYTKFFEITSCGAIGIYSKNSNYREIIQDGRNGILLDNDKEVWIKTILKLINRKDIRSNLFLGAIETYNESKNKACSSYYRNFKKIIKGDNNA